MSADGKSPERDDDFSKMLGAEIRETKRVSRSMSAAIEAWHAHMPPGLEPEFVRITSRRRLIVRVPDSAKRYLAELALRSGAGDKIVAAGNGKFSRLVVEVGAPKP